MMGGVSVMNIERGHIGPRSATTVLMFDAHRTVASRREGGTLAAPGLNAGLLVRRDDKLIAFQGFFLPRALIEVEDSAGFDGKGGISRKDPTAVVPGADGVGVEPSPNGASRDRGNQAGVADLANKIRRVPVRQRNAMSGW